mgnify:CR=1 FL=1
MSSSHLQFGQRKPESRVEELMLMEDMGMSRREIGELVGLSGGRLSVLLSRGRRVREVRGRFGHSA